MAEDVVATARRFPGSTLAVELGAKWSAWSFSSRTCPVSLIFPCTD